MKFDDALLAGRFVRRYTRFFADVMLDGDVAATAHCANPGSMKGCADVDAPCWVSPAVDLPNRPRRKLRYTWELSTHDGALVSVNTARANAIVGEALEAGRVAQAAGYPGLRREVVTGDSRLDFLLSRGDDKLWIEVKQATMSVGAGVIAFPDAVTTRGKKHLDELMALRATGARAMLLFCVARTDAVKLRPADEIDPAYGETLRRAAAAGVELVAYSCTIDPKTSITLSTAIPIDLS